MPYDAAIRLEPGTGGEAAIEIPVESFFWGVSRLGSRAEVRSGEGGADVQDFSFVKRVDTASPALFRLCCSGERLSRAVFSVRERGGDRREMVYTFRDVAISSLRPGGSAGADDAFPSEEVSLCFSACEVEVWPAGRGGAAEPAPQHAAWRADGPEGDPC